ncbi:hypothetical protein PCASD_20741 [Puccinia coronata f. sp. avenae]|uniref:Uncharacterized protein n=1 Tax=Puccinia coronata f. sp. avenae TaxID=200324 RepID=A0A2N5SEN4_9BASI|nr:hypothetical protein PCASD_20741 [Puccinia coronata f. sp. avenae]
MVLGPIIPTTDKDLSDKLKDTFGWCWPPYHVYSEGPSDSTQMCLPLPVIRYFRQLTPDKQQRLLKFKDDKKNARNVQDLEELYKRTWTIRWIFLETINRLYLHHPIDSSSAQFWDDDNLSELYWLRLMDLLTRKNNEGSDTSDLPGECEKKADYPIHINLTPCHPLQSDRPICTNRHVQVESIKHLLSSTGHHSRVWTIGFQDTTCNNNPKLHDICFKRKHPFPNIMISNHIDRLGHMWIEKSSDDGSETDDPIKKPYRILFQKTCSDHDLGLFLWPQFNFKKIGQAFFENQSDFLPDTPKIPVYQDNIIELCDQDRLILFATEYRSHRVFINLQIAIEFCWASEFDEDVSEPDPKHEGENCCKTREKNSMWIDNILQWPNPCQRYSHYVKAPSLYHESDLNDQGYDMQDSRSGIAIIRSEEPECVKDETFCQPKDELDSMETNREGSSNECFLEPEKAKTHRDCGEDNAGLALNSTTNRLFEGTKQVDSSSTDQSGSGIFCHYDSTSSPLQVKFLADIHRDSQPVLQLDEALAVKPEKPQSISQLDPVLSDENREPQSVSQPKETVNPDKENHQKLKPNSRHVKENNSSPKESKKTSHKDGKKPAGSDKSVKRKSPRLIEMAHSNIPTTSSKRKRN